MICFDDKKNLLLVNPRLSEKERAILQELKSAFEKKYGLENFVLVPSSGSSKKSNQSVKVIALTFDSVLNSARRVNKYLAATETQSWGLCLPEFHVAGLGVLSRAFLSGSKVVTIKFDVRDFVRLLSESKINYLSLVPTQIYDLVQSDIRSPELLKRVFVGGGFLSRGLRAKAESLGWPIVETYGMTETASMIAVREAGEENFRVLDGVDVKVEDDCLCVDCNSLLTATIQKINDHVEIKAFDGWYVTEDEAEVKFKNSDKVLDIKGRKSDYVKIFGEGVSVVELRDLLQGISVTKKLNFGQAELLPVEDERSGYGLVLIFEEGVPLQLREAVLNEFNRLCRPYEKVLRTFVLRQIPRTELGKLKTEELKRIIKEQT